MLWPNLFCVAGAFTLGFTSLTTVVLSNLGTYQVYRRMSSALRERPGFDRGPSPRRASFPSRPAAPPQTPRKAGPTRVVANA